MTVRHLEPCGKCGSKDHTIDQCGPTEERRKTDPDVFTKEKIVGKSEVNHPQHYNMGKIEVIDAIEEWCLGFNDGNAVKYVARHKFKNNPIGDLKKAIWYLNREVLRLEKQLEQSGS